MSSQQRDELLRAKPSVSVAIATYQGERYLRQQLASLQEQTLPPFEVVITDDCSDDGTLEIVEEFRRGASFPVRFIQNETRLGYADNFLKAASLCQGDLIAYCDQDDIWMREKLSTCVKHFSKAEVQLVCHAAQTLFDDGQLGFRFPDIRKKKTMQQDACDPLENRPGFAMVFRREVLSVVASAGRPERLYGHDHWVWFLAAFTGTVVRIPDVLCHYRQHEGNLFGVSPDYPVRRMRITAETTRYLDLANAERDCSSFLLSSLPSIPERWRRPARTMAEKLAHRSAWHTKRYLLYGRKAGLFSRTVKYAHIMLTGGYLPDDSKTRLGPKAAFKDFFLGVLGIRPAPDARARA